MSGFEVAAGIGWIARAVAFCFLGLVIGAVGFLPCVSYPDRVKEQAKNTVKRVTGGKFAPGESGNPAGRPPGSRNERTEFLDALLGDDGELIVKQLVDAAKEGNPWAVRLAVERLIPEHGPRRVNVKLGLVDSALAVTAAVADVIALAAGGSITLQDARAFLTLIDFQRRAIETEQLSGRLELLEARLMDREDGQ